MNELASNASLGGIGALMIAAGFILPPAGLMGLALVLMALKRLAALYGEEGIYKNMLRGLIIVVAGIVFGIVVLFFIVVNVQYRVPSPSLGDILIIIGIPAVIWLASAIVANVHYRRALILLSAKSGNKTFETAGSLMLAGAVLAFVVVGLLLIPIAWLLAAMAFFSIKDQR